MSSWVSIPSCAALSRCSSYGSKDEGGSIGPVGLRTETSEPPSQCGLGTAFLLARAASSALRPPYVTIRTAGDSLTASQESACARLAALLTQEPSSSVAVLSVIL